MARRRARVKPAVRHHVGTSFLPRRPGRCQTNDGFRARRIMMMCTIHGRRLQILMAVVTSLALTLPLGRIWSAELPAQAAAARNSPNETSAPTDMVTIEARREREIKRQISKFVSGAVFTYFNDSLERWNTPICPLVAGLSREQGEFVLQRVSQIARDAHAPLGPERCR